MKYSIQLAEPIEFLQKGLSHKALADQLAEFQSGNVNRNKNYDQFFSQLQIAVEQGLATISLRSEG